jgi:MSHA biogenesis protein MshG
MPLFQYKARAIRGDAIQGTIEASSSDVAASRLIEGGLTPINIAVAKEPSSFNKDLRDWFPQPVEIVDLIQFSRQIHSLLRSGVPILRALSGLATNTKNHTLAKVISEVVESLESGRDLSSSMSLHPKVFSLFYVSLVRVGETSGQLPEMFQQLTYYLERERKTIQQIKSAMRYPMFVMAAIGIAMIVINIFVIPKFANTFNRLGADLPLPTKILLATSNFAVDNWLTLLVGLATLILGSHFYIQTDNGRYRWHKLKIRLPLIGPLIYQATLARFSRLFAMGQRAGIPLITSLTVVGRAVDNDFMEERVLGMREGIERGESVSHTAAASGIFDDLVLQMLSVGEESGTLDELLQEVSDYYDREVEYSIEKLSASIEPILIVFIGCMVLMLAIGIFLPMWDLAQAALH